MNRPRIADRRHGCPFNYTGVGQAGHFTIPKIVDHFRRGVREIELGNLHVHREFNDVRWVARVYRDLFEAEVMSAPVNFCSGQMYLLQDVLATRAELAGYEIEVRVNPNFLRASELPELRGDPSRLRGMVGPIEPIPLQETLAWMYEA